MGSLLLEAAEQRAHSLGLDYVVLHVHDDNASARSFYKQAGFSSVSRDPWWASVLLAMKPRWLMVKRLAAPAPGTPSPATSQAEHRDDACCT